MDNYYYLTRIVQDKHVEMTTQAHHWTLLKIARGTTRKAGLPLRVVFIRAGDVLIALGEGLHALYEAKPVLASESLRQSRHGEVGCQ